MSWSTPKLEDCSPGIEPTEYQCLIAMAEKAKQTAGGILLPEAVHDKEQWGSDHARLLACSPLAFSYSKDWPTQARKPQPGDVVFVGKFPGDEITGRDGRAYRLISDREILGIIKEPENG